MQFYTVIILNCLYPLEVECAESVDPIDTVNDVSPQRRHSCWEMLSLRGQQHNVLISFLRQ